MLANEGQASCQHLLQVLIASSDNAPNRRSTDAKKTRDTVSFLVPSHERRRAAQRMQHRPWRRRGPRIRQQRRQAPALGGGSIAVGLAPSQGARLLAWRVVLLALGVGLPLLDAAALSPEMPQFQFEQQAQ